MSNTEKRSDIGSWAVSTFSIMSINSCSIRGIKSSEICIGGDGKPTKDAKTKIPKIWSSSSASYSMVSNALNEGRGIINYCGHGSNYSWVSTGYNITHINALTNDYKLPFIQSIACVNGNFIGRRVLLKPGCVQLMEMPLQEQQPYLLHL